MPQNHSPMRYAAVSLVLIDNLITVLKEKGVLDDSDKSRIIAGAVEGLRNSPNLEFQGAVPLMQQLYQRP